MAKQRFRAAGKCNNCGGPSADTICDNCRCPMCRRVKNLCECPPPGQVDLFDVSGNLNEPIPPREESPPWEESQADTPRQPPRVPPEPPPWPPDDGDNRAAELFEEWKQYHAANPIVWQKFVEYAEQARGVPGSGHNRFGARAIAERIRWYSMIEIQNADFKINNNYIAFYARLLVGLRPAFFGKFFEQREGKYLPPTEAIIAAHEHIQRNR